MLKLIFLKLFTESLVDRILNGPLHVLKLNLLYFLFEIVDGRTGQSHGLVSFNSRFCLVEPSSELLLDL